MSLCVGKSPFFPNFNFPSVTMCLLTVLCVHHHHFPFTLLSLTKQTDLCVLYQWGPLPTDGRFGFANGRHWKRLKKGRWWRLGFSFFCSLSGHMWIVASPSSKDHSPCQRLSPTTVVRFLKSLVTLFPLLTPQTWGCYCQPCGGIPVLFGSSDSDHAFVNHLFINLS